MPPPLQNNDNRNRNRKSTTIRQITTSKSTSSTSSSIGTTLQKNYKRIIVLLLLLIGAIWLVKPATAAAAAMPMPKPKMTGGGGGGGSGSGSNQLLFDTLEILQKFNNDLEQPAISKAPAIAEILQNLRKFSPICAKMSGSGSSCFGIFDNEKNLQETYEFFIKNYPNFFVKKVNFCD